MTIDEAKRAPAAGITRHVLADLAAVDAIADAWKALESRCISELCYFQTFGWCRQWLATFCDDAGDLAPAVQAFRHDGRLVAILPMVTNSSRGITRLETLGLPHTQYSTILIDPDLDAATRAGVEAAVRGVLVDNDAVDVVFVAGVPEGSALSRLLGETPPLALSVNEAALLDLAPYASAEAYSAGLSKTQRRNRTRRRKELARHGELRFSVVWPGDPDFARLALDCARIKRRWLKETARVSSGFAYEDFDTFLAALDGDAGEKRGAMLFALHAGDRLVAAEIGFLLNRHYYAYIGAFDWDFRDASPGKTQMDMTVAWLIDNGADAYDLLANPADYKESWSNRTFRLDTYAIPMTWKGRLYADLWVPRLRPALKSVFMTLPHGLRRLAARGQGLAA